MPVYEYQCQSCEHRIEVIQKFSDLPLTQCEKCGGPLKKVLSPPGLVFKGTGWYVTDYSKKGQQKEKPAPAGDQSATDKGKESGSSSPAKKSSESESPTKKDPSK